MNISSAIVQFSDIDSEQIRKDITVIEGCEIQLAEKNKFIITIEAENIEAEIGIIKKIENIRGVISVRMVFAYSENELEAEREKIELSDDYPEWLNEEETEAKNIPYSGKLKL